MGEQRQGERTKKERARTFTDLLILVNDLAYVDTKSLTILLDEVGRLLGGYLRALKAPPSSH